MRSTFIFCLFAGFIFAGTNSFGQVTDTSIGFVDLHVHTTLKNFTRFVYNPEDVPLVKNNDPIFNKNWTQDTFTKRKEKTSDLRNTQSDYTTISKGNYSIVCTSIATAEKAHLDHWVKRLTAKMGGFKKERMILRRKEENTSFEYFLSEYRYQTLQETQHGDYKKIIVAKDSIDLLRIIRNKDIPVVLTVEGLNALMGAFLSKDNNFKDISHKRKDTEAYSRDYKSIRDELMNNLDSMKKLPHRIFFVSPTHHNWDYIAGQARYFDKNEKIIGIGLRKIIMHLLTPRKKGKRSFSNKNGTGIIDTLHQKHEGEKNELFSFKYSKKRNSCKCPVGRTVEINNICWDIDHIAKADIGRPIFKSLLDKNNRYNKPIYIDVKHMDVQARLDYYEILEELKKKGDSIPIIASHTGVSGKDLNLAYHTGMPPMYDDYTEIDNPAFYTDGKKYEKYRDIRNCIPGLDQSYANCKADMGWFYSLSLNLYKEEIKKIYDSDGLIGIILDERLLGAYSYKYRQKEYKKELRDFFKSKNYSDNEKEEYKEIAPFFRNLVYLVRNSGRNDITAWDHLSIGSDYDGLVDPIDVCLTSAGMTNFEKLCIRYFPDYLEHQKINPSQLFLDQVSIAVAMKKVFRLNAYNFILKYF